MDVVVVDAVVVVVVAIASAKSSRVSLVRDTFAVSEAYPVALARAEKLL